MKTTKTIESISCDFCGQSIDRDDLYDGTGDSNPVGIISLKYDIWYGGIHSVNDSCRTCNNKLARFLQSENMLHGVKN